MKSYLVVTAVAAAMIAIAHLVRALAGVSVAVAGAPVPQSISWLAFVAAGALCVWAHRLLRSGAAGS